MIALLLALAGVSPAGAQPRAVSLDYCADQFLLALADRNQVVALSPMAESDYSYLRKKAAGHLKARPSAEVVLSKQPDVVLRFWGGDARLGPLLEKSGIRIVTLGYTTNFEDVRKNIRTASVALGQKARGEALIKTMDERLKALAAKSSIDVSALYVTPGGVTAASGTMIDEIFKAAGVKNAAAEAGLSGWPPLPAESLLLDPPQFIVAGFFERGTETTNHWSAARHPVFRELFNKTPSAALPPDILSCPAWLSVDAAETISNKFSAGEANHAP